MKIACHCRRCGIVFEVVSAPRREEAFQQIEADLEEGGRRCPECGSPGFDLVGIGERGERSFVSTHGQPD